MSGLLPVLEAADKRKTGVATLLGPKLNPRAMDIKGVSVTCTLLACPSRATALL